MMKTVRYLALVGVMLVCALDDGAIDDEARAASLAVATFDVDSYIFMGTTHDPASPRDHGLPGLALATDVMMADPPSSHFVFAVVEFDDLDGIETKAEGGPNKYLTLSTSAYLEPVSIGVSVVQRNIRSSIDGYPVNPSSIFNLFPGNPTGTAADRLQWYSDNIKGDDELGGASYVGGAPHLGILEVTEPGAYSINVTTTVDAWIDGDIPNHGFGLWGMLAPGLGPGETIEFASIENGTTAGPTLEALPVGGVESGDFDTDGDVDGYDFLVWQRGFGMLEDAGVSDGDANGDGATDDGDLALWQNQFGMMNAVENEFVVAAVPEPSTLMAAICLLSGWFVLWLGASAKTLQS